MSKLETIAQIYKSANGDVEVTGELEQAIYDALDQAAQFHKTWQWYEERGEKVPPIMMWRLLNALDVLNGTKDI